MRKDFKDSILEISKNNKKIVLVFGDISVFLFKEFWDKYPDKFFNMGICENSLISLSAGLSSKGFIPFVHSINPFITDRSLEQIKLDLCYNNFPVNIVTTGASFDYAWDGATHHCYDDLLMIKNLPNTKVFQPGSETELKFLIKDNYNNGFTNYFRLSDHPHGINFKNKIKKEKAIEVLKSETAKITVLTAGPILKNVLPACQDLNVNLIYFHTIKPIDKKIINKYKNTKMIIIHDAQGLQEAINETNGLNTYFKGPSTDKFEVCYGNIDNMRKKIGLDINSIRKFIKSVY